MPIEPRRSLILLPGIVLEGGLGLLAWLLGWLLDQPVLSHWRWNARDAVLGLPASLPLLAAFVLCVRWPVGPLARIKQFTDEFIRPLFAPCTVFDLALLSLLAGVGEELLFRGVLQPAFGSWFGVWPGLLAASALFGLLHLVTPAYAVMAGVMGAYLGWVFLATDNLLVVMIAHGFYDFLALLYLVRGGKPSVVPAELEPPTVDAPLPPS
jgi:membrane protease YdiL (CAAX protease family)